MVPSFAGYKVRRFLKTLSRLKITATSRSQSPFHLDPSSPDSPLGKQGELFIRKCLSKVQIALNYCPGKLTRY